MTAHERTTPTSAPNVSAPVVVESRLPGATPSDTGIRKELNYTIARRVIELPAGRRPAMAATG